MITSINKSIEEGECTQKNLEALIKDVKEHLELKGKKPNPEMQGRITHLQSRNQDLSQKLEEEKKSREKAILDERENARKEAQIQRLTWQNKMMKQKNFF